MNDLSAIAKTHADRFADELRTRYSNASVTVMLCDGDNVALGTTQLAAPRDVCASFARMLGDAAKRMTAQIAAWDLAHETGCLFPEAAEKARVQ